MFRKDNFNLKEKLSSTKKQIFEAFTGFLSYRSDNQDQKNSLRLNKTFAELFEALNAKLFKALFSEIYYLLHKKKPITNHLIGFPGSNTKKKIF